MEREKLNRQQKQKFHDNRPVWEAENYDTQSRGKGVSLEKEKESWRKAINFCSAF